MKARPAPPPILVYQTMTVLRIGLLLWARDTVIGLRPDLYARRAEAAALLEDEDPDVSWAAVNAFADVYAEAMTVVTTPGGAA